MDAPERADYDRSVRPGRKLEVAMSRDENESGPEGTRRSRKRTNRVEKKLKAHASTAFDKESPEPNKQKYPERARQEAVINAMVHRDYEEEAPTSITVFSDRVEIRSPGALPRSVNKEKFLLGNASPAWRNQSLAYFFNKLQLAQAEGQGIPTIIRTMQLLGSPAPKFDLEESAVSCVLPAHPRHETLRQLAQPR